MMTPEDELMVRSGCDDPDWECADCGHSFHSGVCQVELGDTLVGEIPILMAQGPCGCLEFVDPE